MYYRREVDGLRAIAVIPVIFFHAGFSGFSGGFVGVDVFFVISGYLITSIILKEHESNKFSLVNFYERRARRILPALSVVLVLTTFTAYTLMSPEFLESYAKSLISVTLFASNIFFNLESGYFSTASEEKPLLHTWSLAVEEQYYIFFPVLIMLFWTLGKKSLALIISTLLIISLAYCQYLANLGLVNENFYLIFSRAWELFVGSLIAFVNPNAYQIKNKIKDILGWLGLGLIIYSVIFYDKNTPFPSVYALVPVIGAAMIIFFCNEKTSSGRFLSNRLFVAIGLISYSLYLWHQPIFAFLRLKTIGTPSAEYFVLAILMTTIFAYLSYKFVETPFRNKTLITRPVIFGLSLFALGSFFLVGLVGYKNDGLESRFGEDHFYKSIEFSPKRNQCHTRGKDYLNPKDACEYFGEDKSWAVFGDSHMVEVGYALAQKLKKDNTGLAHFSFSGCPPALNFNPQKPGCSEWTNEALEYIEQSDTIKNILIGYRYAFYLQGGHLESYPAIPNHDPEYKKFNEKAGQALATSEEILWESLSEIVSRLVTSGKRVYLLYPIPELPAHISKLVTPFSIYNHDYPLDLTNTVSKEHYEGRNKFILDKLDGFAFNNNVIPIKTYDILCNDNFCPAIEGEYALYFDDNHLSVEGARILLEKSSIF